MQNNDYIAPFKGNTKAVLPIIARRFEIYCLIKWILFIRKTLLPENVSTYHRI